MDQTGMVTFDPEKLRAQMMKSLKKLGVNDDSIHHVVTSMLQTSLRGVDSHGINLYPHYHRSFISGRLSTQPNFTRVKDGPSFVVLDAGHAIGHHAGSEAMRIAMEKAGNTGVGIGVVQNSSHFGASAYFALQAAEKDMIGMAFTNADALVKAFNGKESFFGTNPICFTAPMANEGPFCLDMATSIVSWNKIKNYRRADEPLEEGWAFDKEGLPVTDPHQAASLNSIGGYKGFGLGMMVEILCAVITNSVIGKDMLAMFTSPPEAQRQVGHFFLAMDLSQISDVNTFKNTMQNMCDRIRNEEPIGDQKVMVPGDPEKITYKDRIHSGIPAFESVYQEYIDADPDFANCLK